MQSQASGEPSEPAASILAQVRCGATVQHSSAVHGSAPQVTPSAAALMSLVSAEQSNASSATPLASVSAQVRVLEPLGGGGLPAGAAQLRAGDASGH